MSCMHLVIKLKTDSHLSWIGYDQIKFINVCLFETLLAYILQFILDRLSVYQLQIYMAADVGALVGADTEDVRKSKNKISKKSQNPTMN